MCIRYALFWKALSSVLRPPVDSSERGSCYPITSGWSGVVYVLFATPQFSSGPSSPRATSRQHWMTNAEMRRADTIPNQSRKVLSPSASAKGDSSKCSFDAYADVFFVGLIAALPAPIGLASPLALPLTFLSVVWESLEEGKFEVLLSLARPSRALLNYFSMSDM